MEEGKFRVLVHMLKSMEGSKGSSMEGAIIHIIETFKDAMTEEQKKETMEEFERYEKIRKDMEARGKFEEVMHSEKYRELCHRQTFKEETEFGEY